MAADANYGRRRMLTPLRSRAWWVAGGLILQAAGAGGVAAYLWLKIRHQGIGGHLTAATIQLAWHGEIHTRPGLAVLAAGAAVYAAGSVLMARPYISRPATLFVAVPLAALAGLLALGALAIVAALVILIIQGFDLPLDFDFGDRRRRSKRRRG